ncbi:hypothetical protein OAG71_03620 [bacterium]|nr:hypothetical protein [bacterium]
MEFLFDERLACVRLGLRRALLFCWVTFGLMASDFALAGGGPENVFLVVNGESRSSKVIANHYIAMRNIPPGHVIYLKGISKREIISLPDFRKQILEPVLSEMVLRRINENIDYIVYSSDFPTRVGIGDHQKLLKELVGSRFQAKIYAPVASLTSMTYFASQVIVDDPTYMTLESNNYYRLPYRSVLRAPFEGDAQEEYRQAVAAINKTGDEFGDAKDTLQKLSRKYPGQAAVHYQLAKFLAKGNEVVPAIQALNLAAAMGWQDADMIEREKDFDSLQTHPQFKKLLDRISEIESPFLSPHGFRNAYWWAPNGMINKSGQGRRYFLSAMLSVTRDYGISDRDSIFYLSRAVNSDESRPQGTFYFTQTKDVRTTTRVRNFPPAIQVLKQMGYEARIEKTVLPTKRDDMLGLSCGTPKFDFEASECKFIPGAFGDNLTSSGGIFINSSQTKLTEFLRFGAAGACGTVVEPFALQAKFPHPMIHTYYVAGCSLAEAFYQSVQGPYQIILVADPLCQPFVKRPKIFVTSPSPMAEVAGEVKIELSREGSEVATAGVEIFLDGAMIHRAPNIESINLDTSDLKDGFHEVRVVSVARDGVEARGTAILPLIVNNKDHYTKLLIEKTEYEFPRPIKVTAETNFGDKIVIRQNFKTVGVITSSKGSTEISTASLGVGPIRLQAIAYREGENAGVASTPVKLSVTGSISTSPEQK